MQLAKIGTYLLVIVICLITVITWYGWVAFTNNNVRLDALQAQQSAILFKLNSFKDGLEDLSQEMRNYSQNVDQLSGDFQVVEKALEATKMRNEQIASRIGTFSTRLDELQVVYDAMIQMVTELKSQLSFLEEDAVKNVELGEVSVEKDTPPQPSE